MTKKIWKWLDFLDFANLPDDQKNGCIVFDNEDKFWYKDGKHHRDDGPACEYQDGTKEWYREDLLHREGGPAREYSDGGKDWYKDDKLHRLDGPAIEFANGNKIWYIEGKRYTEEEFKIKAFAILNNLEKFL